MVALYVGITDLDWFDVLSRQTDLDEVNFWQPGGKTNFRALEPGELFLFKLHAPRNYIVGGGVFFRSLILPVSLAWEAFGIRNGCRSLAEMRTRISRYRRDATGLAEYNIGCRILVQPFFMPESHWIPIPPSWASSIQTGKRYTTDQSDGQMLWDAVQNQLPIASQPGLGDPGQARYGEPILIKPRLGQGAFRIAVADAYERRCVVTRERTLPALEAAHIRPYAEGGSHEVQNGLLFRRDIHKLFDLNYVTVTTDGILEVSRRIREEYENGRAYYALHGSKIADPVSADLRPSRALLEWHNERFRG